MNSVNLMSMLTRCTQDDVEDPEAKVPAEARLVDALQNVTKACQAMRDEQQKVAAALTDLAAAQKPAEPEEAPAEEDLAARIIEMTAVVNRVFRVDTVNQTFAVSLSVQMLWDMPENEEPPQAWEDDGDWVPKWRPVYRLRRVIEEVSRVERFYSVKVNGKRMVKGECEQIAVLFEELELQAFPVDCQDLTILLESTQAMDQVQWRPDQTVAKPPVRLGGAKFALSDFVLVVMKSGRRNLPGFTYHFGKEEYPQEQKACCQLQIVLKVQRKYQYYMINVALMMFALVSLVLTAWFNHPADIADRQGVDFNLILTAVAFKLVLNSFLPMVSYMTLLDYYVMGGFFFLIMVTICHSVLPFLYGVKVTDNSPLTLPPNSYADEEDLVLLDELALYCFGVFWVAFNVCYGMIFFCIKSYRYKHFVRQAFEEQRDWDKDNLVASGGKVVQSSLKALPSGTK